MTMVVISSGFLPLLEDNADAARDDAKEGRSGVAKVVISSGFLPLLEDNADAARDDAKEGRSGVAKVVIGAITKRKGDDKGVPEVEMDGVFDANGLDDENSEAEVESEGLPTVAAPSSKRADVVLQQRVPSPIDSQQ